MGCVGDFVRAVGGWWLGAVFLVVGAAGAVLLNWGGYLAAGLTAVGMLLFLAGAYRAYHRVSQQRDELWARLDPDETRFTIKAAVPYADMPFVINRLIVPDVHVVNWSETPIQLRFTLLAADGSGILESDMAWSGASTAGTVLPNPMRLDCHSTRSGRLAWLHGGGEVTQYVIAGVVLRVRDELSELRADIPLPTPTSGYDCPERIAAT